MAAEPARAAPAPPPPPGRLRAAARVAFHGRWHRSPGPAPAAGRRGVVHGVRDMGSTVAAGMAGLLVVFLVGALAVQVRSSLHFGPAALGLAVSAYFAASALGSVPLGRLAEVVGGARVMRATSLAAAVVLVLVAAVARSWAELCVLLFAAGLVGSAVQPATNVFLARRFSGGHQGLVFGVKQAGVPSCVLLAGVAVPAVALTIGWRWAFVAGAAVAAAAGAVVPRPRSTLAERRARPVARRRPGSTLPLVVLSAGFGLGVFASSGLGSFTVLSAVATGISPSDAGLLAALGGVASVTSRVVAGARADRRGRGHLTAVAGMLAVGSFGYALMAFATTGRPHLVFVVGLVLAYGAGWGWNGLFAFAVVRTHPEVPALATGITQVGASVASAAGPLTFGLVVAHGSYADAWALDAVVTLAGVGVILLGRRLLVARLGALTEQGAPELAG